MAPDVLIVTQAHDPTTDYLLPYLDDEGLTWCRWDPGTVSTQSAASMQFAEGRWHDFTIVLEYGGRCGLTTLGSFGTADPRRTMLLGRPQPRVSPASSISKRAGFWPDSGNACHGLWSIDPTLVIWLRSRLSNCRQRPSLASACHAPAWAAPPLAYSLCGTRRAGS